MSKANELAKKLEQRQILTTDDGSPLEQAASLLRQQDEALKMALEALIWEAGSEPSLYSPQTAKAIAKIKELT